MNKLEKGGKVIWNLLVGLSFAVIAFFLIKISGYVFSASASLINFNSSFLNIICVGIIALLVFLVPICFIVIVSPNIHQNYSYRLVFFIVVTVIWFFANEINEFFSLSDFNESTSLIFVLCSVGHCFYLADKAFGWNSFN